jgi:hypothetical protein
MPDLTFITPVSLAHRALADRALASVEAQSAPCKALTMLDTDKRGPGYLRNMMLRQVDTEFVSYLDADDWIEPTFAEETVAEYRRIGGDRYIYTDWFDNHGHAIATPCLNGPDGYPLSVPDRKPWCGGTWHPITTLIPTEWAKAAPFDETMPASEDSEMYLHLCTTMRCGHHLPRALFHYSPGGGRAIAFREGPERDRIAQELTVRYGGRMGCCGNDETVALPIGERQAGDVLAMALWHGNRGEYGRATGRHYPRVSMPKTAWVDPRDCSMSPNLWKVLPAVDTPQPMTSVKQIADAGMVTVKRNPYAAQVGNEPPPPPVTAKPDVSRVIRLAQKAAGQTSEPVFVFPEKAYPSYSDFRRLVELSGYHAVTFKQMDFFSRAPYIVVSPEPLPALGEYRASIIAWQLEYAGDYAHNYDTFTGEVWASDKAWADAHADKYVGGAKYVLLGSHPGLADGEPLEPLYDLTLLGYMTPRRQHIKGLLADLRWPIDYPGHDTTERDTILLRTRLMLNIHQHDGAPYIAPQRIALAAAHHMPVLCEAVENAGDLADVLTFAAYGSIPQVAREILADGAKTDVLYRHLCIEHPFRKGVEEALKR